MVEVENAVTFTTSNGGEVRMVGTGRGLDEVGWAGGYAYYDDLYVDPSVPVTLDISEEYDTTATVQHITGDPVVRFRLISRQTNGTADIKLTGLQPDGWYRLQFNGVLAKTASGRAHGHASDGGELVFTNVELPT
jgi:hypothetical protein